MPLINRMIYLKTDEEIELMREANQLVGKTLGEVAKHIVPGVSTLQLIRLRKSSLEIMGLFLLSRDFRTNMAIRFRLRFVLL